MGADILCEKESWYKTDRIKYIKLDQSNVSHLEANFKTLNNPKIIIDDGSHHPIHQLIFLDISTSEILRRTNNEKKTIILEDIHTSLTRAIESRNFFLKKRNQLKEFFRKILREKK